MTSYRLYLSFGFVSVQNGVTRENGDRQSRPDAVAAFSLRSR